jgi:Mrp family chromosome partitioning ATPase
MWSLSLHHMEVNILLKYIRCQEKGKCAYIHGYSGVENVAEQKPINYIMENLSHK